MSSCNKALAQLTDNGALITAAGRSFEVARRDDRAARAGCPMHLLVGALGACIAMTLDAVAEHKGIDITDLKVHVGYEKDKAGGTQFQVDLNLSPTLTDRERKILYQSARLCEVGKLLKGDVQIDYQVHIPELAN